MTYFVLHFFRTDAFRVAASDIGLITKVFVELYNTGQTKKWFLEKVTLTLQISR